MRSPALYHRHLDTLERVLADALARAGRRGIRARAVLLYAGRAMEYHRDDQEVVFHPAPHFARYAPLAEPHACVFAQPGRRPLVARVVPRDFWYEKKPPEPSYWQDAVDLVEVESLAELSRAVGSLEGVAYLGNDPQAAAALGIPPELVEPEPLVAPLDWYRAEKTEHEVSLMQEAAVRAARGHAAARDRFMAGDSEREIHWAYLAATDHLERELPYETIVAFDEKSSILHYQNKRGAEARARHTFLLDAGAAVDGYASDITRTWVRDDADPIFRGLLEGLDAVQRQLVNQVTAGRAYLDIHLETHRQVGRLLAESGIVLADADEAFTRGVTRAFLPHGVGHHLGLQVHDVGGRQAGPDGGTRAAPPEHPFLRNTRTLAPGHVVTIEPGIYFIPMLLGPLRASAAGELVDWALVERLLPFGGMRIEDDIFCAPEGPRDLTRPHIEGPRGT
jgi:Xaa-Pro dipeptidase